MAFPLIITILGVGALVAKCAPKLVKAVSNMKKAERVTAKGKDIFNGAIIKLEEKKTQTNSTLENYGQQKMNAYNSEIGSFIKLYDQIENVENLQFSEFDNLIFENTIDVTISDIRRSYKSIASIIKGISPDAAKAAFLTYGSYNGAMALACAGKAGTGALISGLKGIAARNATLAWLGGGPVAVGGAGMAGGTVVLGVVVVGPLLVFLSDVLSDQALQKLRNEEIENDKILAEVEEMCKKLDEIEEVVALGADIMSKLAIQSQSANTALENVINISGIDYKFYSETEKDRVSNAVKYVKAIKIIIDSSVVEDDGTLNPKSKITFEEVQNQIL